MEEQRLKECLDLWSRWMNKVEKCYVFGENVHGLLRGIKTVRSKLYALSPPPLHKSLLPSTSKYLNFHTMSIFCLPFSYGTFHKSLGPLLA